MEEPVSSESDSDHENPPTVLIVEDDEAVRECICWVLLENGLQVAFADNGNLALEMLLAESFDCVVMDLVMPGMSGAGVMEELRERKRQVPVVLVSGYVGMLDAARYRQLGANAVFKKPFNIEDLAKAVTLAANGKPIPAELGGTPLKEEEEFPSWREGLRDNVAGRGQLELKIENCGPAVIVHAEGRVTSYRESELREALSRLMQEGRGKKPGERPAIVIDLTAAEFVSSTELGVFLFYQKKLEAEGSCLLLAGPNPRARRVLEISNLAKVLNVFDSVDAALKHVGGG
jgi:anti-anti-sigma factor